MFCRYIYAGIWYIHTQRHKYFCNMHIIKIVVLIFCYGVAGPGEVLIPSTLMKKFDRRVDCFTLLQTPVHV